MARGLLEIDCLPLGDFQTNCYLIRPASQAECWVVDPGLGVEPALDRLSELGLRVERIVLTHGHADHIAGVAAIQSAHPQAVITAPADDARMLTDPVLNLSAPFGLSLTAPPAQELVRPGDELHLGATCWQVLDTSGHTPGGVSYYCAEAETALVGDALFAGSIGRCDLPGSDYDRLVESIRRNLLSLPTATRILPGHGPATTVADEARTNPYVGRAAR